MKKPFVLIIDDQPGIRMLLLETFKLEMVEVEAVSSGEEVLEIIYIRSPDLIFVDLKMPKKDGFTVISDLKEKGFKGHIVIMTGMDIPSAEEKQVDYVLKKPFDIDEALMILHKLLKSNKEKMLS